MSPTDPNAPAVPDLISDPVDSDDDSDYNPLPTPQPAPGNIAANPPGQNLNPHLPNLAQANAKVYVPPKQNVEGSFKYAHYVPAWTDPEWKDDGPERQKSDWSIKNGLVDRVRPALLARDQLRNPTPYAQRFGIFPGRDDGRSRTSPTRADSRFLFGDLLFGGDVRTGKELFDRLGEVAQEKGIPVEEFMASEKPQLKTMPQLEQAYMLAYQELLVDEYWQGVCFGNLTMDELIANNHFTMGDAISDLDGPLYPLFERDRWTDTRWNGAEKELPRVLYDIDGERAEFDPRTNDRLWNALQPSLQLATRLIGADDPFMIALADITNRTSIDPQLETRDAARIAAAPAFKFERKQDLYGFGQGWLHSAAELKCVPGLIPAHMSWAVLFRHIKMEIYSGHHERAEGKFTRYQVSGVTEFKALLVDTAPMKISIAADLVWPLLVDGFSQSEKMMANFTLAMTVAHEVMHAWAAAPYKWLGNPRSYGISDQDTIDKCNNLLQDIFPLGFVGSEPYFEDDPVAEVGHAFETHVLGGGTWPMGAPFFSYGGPKLLEDFPCVVAQQSWPEGNVNKTPNLKAPITRPNAVFSYRRVDEIQKYFRKEFWQNVVPKYGMAAMRAPPPKPALACLGHDQDEHFFDLLHESNFGTPADRQEIAQYVSTLLISGKFTLGTYVKSIVQESCQFDLMVPRFLKDMVTWPWTEKKYLASVGTLCLMIHEFRAAVALTNRNKSQSERDAIVKQEHAAWETMLLTDTSYADSQSMKCWDGTIETFTAVIQITHDEYERRMVPIFMQFAHDLDHELKRHESMICELYQLAPEFWQHYIRAVPYHHGFWKSRLGRIINGLRFIINKLETVGALLPMWRNEWNGRMRSYIQWYSDLYQIVRQDISNVASNWRDSLVTTPMLRKCHRKPRERWFFLAKKEMLALTGKELEDMKAFKTRFENILNLNSTKIVLPPETFDENDEQALAQLWEGLLDDGVEREMSGNQLNGIFNTDGVEELTARLQQQKKEEDAAKVERAAAKAEENAAAAAAKKNESQKSKVPKPKNPTLQEMAEAQAGKAPSIDPQVTNPSILHQPHPLSGLRALQNLHVEQIKFGEASRPASPGGSGSGSVRMDTSAFSSYASTPNRFATPPVPASTPPPWQAQGSAQLAVGIHQPFGGVSTPPGPMVGLMPHPYAIRETITKDLLNVVATQLPTTLPPSLSQQPPRAGKPLPRPAQGKGKLGDVEKKWEQQQRRSLTPQTPRTPLTGDEDEEMTDAGHIFLARLEVVDTDSAEDEESEIEGARLLRESSDSTAVESEGYSGGETDVESGVESGSDTGLKRKLSVLDVDDEEVDEARGKLLNRLGTGAMKRAKVGR
ncbi:Fc.00g085270.m01.CDS01 [Cosmosporella sp. VM-42]